MIPSEHPAVPSQTTSEEPASGTLVKEDGDEIPKHVPDHSVASQAEAEPMANDIDAEEQALESHEVIELQTFSERKAWIEEKIKVSILTKRSW